MRVNDEFPTSRSSGGSAELIVVPLYKHTNIDDNEDI